MAVMDLKVHVEKLTTLVPARPTPQEFVFLSNIDHTVVFPVETVYFYRPKVGNDFDALFDGIAEAMRELLIAYYFLAGRLKFNPEKGRLEIDCNAAGVPFAKASSELSMDDLGEIGFVNPGYKSLILPQIEDANPSSLTLQVTRFKCGGLAVGLCTNHAFMDGLSVAQFLHNLASLTIGKGMVYQPIFDRTSLKARDPPIINYDHLEMRKLDDMIGGNVGAAFTARGGSADTSSLSNMSSLHSYRSFPFSSHVLIELKQKILEDGSLTTCSTFEAILAHVWQARVKSMDMDPSQPTSVLFAVDIRKRVQPPLPPSFVGNGILTAYARATAGEICDKPLSFCVSKVQEGIARLTPDYIKSAIDWMELHKGIPAVGLHGNFFLSAWWKLPFHKLDFGWGEPIYAGPIISGIVDIVLLISDCGNDEGLNLLLALQPHEMTKFESHIQTL